MVANVSDGVDEIVEEGLTPLLLDWSKLALAVL